MSSNTMLSDAQKAWYASVRNDQIETWRDYKENFGNRCVEWRDPSNIAGSSLNWKIERREAVRQAAYDLPDFDGGDSLRHDLLNRLAHGSVPDPEDRGPSNIDTVMTELTDFYRSLDIDAIAACQYLAVTDAQIQEWQEVAASILELHTRFVDSWASGDEAEVAARIQEATKATGQAIMTLPDLDGGHKLRDELSARMLSYFNAAGSRGNGGSDTQPEIMEDTVKRVSGFYSSLAQRAQDKRSER